MGSRGNEADGSRMRGGLALGLAVLATADCASGAVTGPQSGAHATIGLVVDRMRVRRQG
jgi:hypothetical protein